MRGSTIRVGETGVGVRGRTYARGVFKHIYFLLSTNMLIITTGSRSRSRMAATITNNSISNTPRRSTRIYLNSFVMKSLNIRLTCLIAFLMAIAPANFFFISFTIGFVIVSIRLGVIKKVIPNSCSVGTIHGCTT